MINWDNDRFYPISTVNLSSRLLTDSYISAGILLTKFVADILYDLFSIH